jgi:broad specificity phosphatase PhoE
VRRLILVRHGEAVSNLEGVVSGIPPGAGLSATGVEQARELGRALAAVPIDIGVCSRFSRAGETLDLALAERGLPITVEPLLDEIAFGSFEGAPLADYRAWAHHHDAEVPCPGGGESRAAAAARFAEALDALLERQEETVLAVSHALPIRYVLDAADGDFPAVSIAAVPHATPFTLSSAAVEIAAATLAAWADEPRFADTPFGG